MFLTVGGVDYSHVWSLNMDEQFTGLCKVNGIDDPINCVLSVEVVYWGLSVSIIYMRGCILKHSMTNYMCDNVSHTGYFSMIGLKYIHVFCYFWQIIYISGIQIVYILSYISGLYIVFYWYTFQGCILFIYWYTYSVSHLKVRNK